MRHLLALLVPLVLSGFAAAQNCTAVLLDGSKIHGTLIDKSIEVKTSYGTVNVPWTEVNHIKLGLHFPEGVEKEISSAIKELASDAFPKRDAAHRKLVLLGRHSYLLVSEEITNSKDTETKRRAAEIKAKIEEDIRASEIRAIKYDYVVAKEASLKGRIVTPVIKVKTKHLGDVDLKICTLDSFVLGFNGGDFKIGGKYCTKAGNVWFDSKIYISDQAKWSLQASGTIDLWPQQAGQYMATPKGGANNSNFGGWPAGSLIGKIGETGREFLLGESYNAETSIINQDTGSLYLRINYSAWDTPAVSGEYTVRVK